RSPARSCLRAEGPCRALHHVFPAALQHGVLLRRPGIVRSSAQYVRSRTSGAPLVLRIRAAPHPGYGHYTFGLWASQRPASAAANSSASAAFTAAGSSLLMVWPARGVTRSAAVGAGRLWKKLPPRQRAGPSPAITRRG